MSIEVRKVKTAKDLKAFIRFPHKLYGNSTCWVPPMNLSEKWILSRKKNPSFEHGDADYFLAYKNGELAGRVAALVNYRANAKSGEDFARFGWIDFVDDNEVSAALLAAVENWAREKSLTGVHGPFGFTDFDYEGMLIEGFENPGGITVIYNHSYYPAHLEKLGYTKADDWLQYKLPASQPVPRSVEVVRKKVESQYNLRVVFPKSQWQMKRCMKQVLKLVNVSFAHLYGFVEYTEKEQAFFISNMLFVARPNMSCFLFDEQKNMVAFAVVLPSQTKAFQRSHGKLIPFGVLRMLWAKYFFKDIELTMIGVHPDWQRKGVHALLHDELNKMFIRRKIRYAITNPQLETNLNAIGVWSNYEKELYARRRCYVKKLE